jgi:hypothetical protein
MRQHVYEHELFRTLEGAYRWTGPRWDVALDGYADVDALIAALPPSEP